MDGFWDTKVCFWRRWRPRSKTCCQGWHRLLEDSTWPRWPPVCFKEPSLGSGAVGPQATASSTCCSREVADSSRDHVTARRWLHKSMDHTPDISPGSLIFGRLTLPISEWAVFRVSPPLTFMAPHLCMKGQNRCRNRKSAGVPGLKLLLPLANVFSVSRPDYTLLFTEARQNLTVNSLRKGTP